MPSRVAACDPCRTSKLACDHSRPVCSRCHQRNLDASCSYRPRPFKRKKPPSSTAITERTSQRLRDVQPTASASSLTRVPASSSNYPNPGYLGSSSHATIYDHLPGFSHKLGSSATTIETNSHRQSKVRVSDTQVSNGAKLIDEIIHFASISSCGRLVEAWITKGVNLALAGLFTEPCTKTAAYVINLANEGIQNATEISQNLFISSCTPLKISACTNVDDFCANFCQANARWETLGLFFAAVSRATSDTDSFESLFETEQQRQSFRKTATHYSDCCLDTALSLDCLNDLQLVLQYENCIARSWADGDQSYPVWRKLGDVASSLFALGYHERIEGQNPIPAFLKDLRKAAFARAYSDDKNLSIFLGRPPRISRKYCRFEALGQIAQSLPEDGALSWQFPCADGQVFDYVTDTWWSAMCARLKEEVLDLFRDESHDGQIRKVGVIQSNAEAQWLALPQRFRLEGPLKLCDQKPIDRDFMVAAKLQHLHVLFLLRLALVRHIPSPSSELVTVSVDMLSLVVEASMLKNYLVNSGTGLVAYYGLPAAGIICLYLLKRSFAVEASDISRSEALQNLSVLVAEVKSGALVHFDDPNYALLDEATGTIKSILDRLMSGDATEGVHFQSDSNIESQSSSIQNAEHWTPWNDHDFWDFEMDFWLNLADHPALV